MHRLWIGFVPFAVVSIVHVGALALGAERGRRPDEAPAHAAARRRRLLGRPRLALGHAATRSCSPRSRCRGSATAPARSSPALPTVPTMLLFFGLAHLCYIWLFWRILAVRRVPPWAVVYGLWFGVLLAVLWPHLGGLLIAVALYGLVLGGTAVAASRCHPLIAWGGAFFLASDTILAFELFMPDATPDWASPVVMFTYCLGQGLIAAGRHRRRPPAHRRRRAPKRRERTP